MKGDDWAVLLGWLLILFFIAYMIAQILRVIV
ncbi:membrane protein [Gordonia phage AikoCarson]|nr:membrane protein [Gordonia phage AikoCarson]